MLNHNKILQKRTSGVTFIELLVTVVIISVMMTLAFTNYNNTINRQSTSNATDQAAFALKEARQYAKRNGIITQVFFPVSQNEYEIYAGTSKILSSSDSGEGSGVLPSNTKILSNSCGEFYFYIDGTPLIDYTETVEDNGDKVIIINPVDETCTIKIGISDSNSKTIKVHAFSGNITYD